MKVRPLKISSVISSDPLKNEYSSEKKSKLTDEVNISPVSSPSSRPPRLTSVAPGHSSTIVQTSAPPPSSSPAPIATVAPLADTCDTVVPSRSLVTADNAPFPNNHISAVNDISKLLGNDVCPC